MDVIKTVLIASIAVVLYYLLLQWPTQANTPEKGGRNIQPNANGFGR